MANYRLDASAGAAAAKLDDNGYFRASGVIAKVGVYKYVNADGTIRTEFVSPECLADVVANQTLAGVPATVGHPQEGKVTANTANIYSKGSVAGTPHFDGEYLRGDVVITHADAVERIDQQKIYSLSPGYDTEIEYKPGSYKGERYDFIQVKRYYNHLALVTDARGGKDCKLNLDGLDYAIAVGIDHFNNDSNEGKKMATVTLPNGVTVEVGDAATANTIQQAFRADADDKAALKTKMDEAKASYDELKGKFDALEEGAKKDEKDDEDKVPASEVADRVDSMLVILDQAKTIKSDITVRADGKLKSPRELMCEALGKDFKDESDVYVKARFDAAIEMATAEKTKANITNQRTTNADGTVKLSVVETHRKAFFEGKA